jgi:hypothetical protein
VQKPPRKPTFADARKTCLIVAGVLTAVALFSWYRGNGRTMIITASIAGVLAAIGLFVPPLAILFHRGWMRFAHALGWINSRIILSLVYFLVFVPYKIFSRLAGRDPLALRQPRGGSYWTKREKTRQAREGFERLF